MSNRWTRAAEKLLPVYRSAMQTYGEEIKTIGEQYADALLAIDDLLLIIGG